jgi:hypothetical protein
MWAIAFSPNKRPKLYTGTNLTREDAIDDHCWRYADFPPYVGKSRKQIWRKCRKIGDRAVKVTITYEYPE